MISSSGTLRGSSIERPASLAAVIVDEFVRLVADGTIKIGDRLPSESELAEAWGVGRSSLREAFRMFQLLGVVESARGRGTVLVNAAPLFMLTEWSRFTGAGAVADIVEARLVLESAVVRLAAERATTDDIERVGETIARGRAAIGDSEASIQASLDFHTAVAAATGNQTLLLVTRLLRSLYHQSTYLSRRNPANYASLLQDHEQILEAIMSHDPEQAAQCTASHLRQGISFVLQDEADEESGHA